MTTIKLARISFSPSKKCFVNIPRGWDNVTQKNAIIIVESANSGVKGYFTWSGTYTAETDISIDGIFGKKLGFHHEEDVIVTIAVGDEIPCKKVFLVPSSNLDWELVHNYSTYLESSLMAQIKNVYRDLEFPFWIPEGNMCVFLKVVEVNPSGLVVSLQEMTEVEIVDSSFQVSSTDTTTSKESGLVNMFSSMISSLIHGKSNADGNLNSHSESLSGYSLSSDKYLRLLYPVDIREDTSHYINTVFIHPDVDIGKSEVLIGRLRLILSPYEEEVKGMTKNNDEDNSRNVDTIQTIVRIIPDISIPVGHIVPCESLIRQLGLQRFHRICLSPLQPSQSIFTSSKVKVHQSSSLELIPMDALSNVHCMDIFSELLQKQPLDMAILAGQTLISIKKRDFLCKIDEYEPTAITHRNFLDIKFCEPRLTLQKTSWGQSLPLKSIPIQKKSMDTTHLDNNFLKTQRLSIEHIISLQLKNDKVDRRCVIVSGEKGSGQNCLLKLINTKHPLVFIKNVDCKILRGKRIDSLHKLLKRDFQEASYCQPSILIFQDLDVLIPQSTDQDSPVETFYLKRVATLFLQFLEELFQDMTNKVTVICSVKDQHFLHGLIVKSPLINHFIEIPLPNEEDRQLLISNFIKRYKLSATNDIIANISKETEGCTPSDLNRLITSMVTTKLQSKRQKNPSTITHNIASRCLSSFKPSSLSSIKLSASSSSCRKLDSVGGLHDVKRTIRETLLWPSRYPHLMKKCPLRPSSCILLYGPPGTGKTLLAECAANECAINFISIEGPELLSKYIGSSEESVRDLFARAKSAKPCIIFFDEFDSIAPRRGADTTGVTDRVVNQLLTQMDGVEGLDRGIFILAATSRPDLIDPALLRPGRFDKCLHCRLPDRQERKDILGVFMKNFNISGNIDIELVADGTEGFSGADLQAILTNAQVMAANRVLKDVCNLQDSNQESDRFKIHPEDFMSKEDVKNVLESNTIVTSESTTSEDALSLIILSEDIMSTLRKAKPSMSQEERTKYALIYKLFEEGKQLPGEKKVTLA